MDQIANKTSGKFITFEGGEGSGKSTQARMLEDRLRAFGVGVKLTREPGGTATAESIRRVILSGLFKDLGADDEAVLFAAARADHVERVIRPALASGHWVLCDRFADSTHAYQGAAGGAEGAFLDALDRVAVGRTWPDLTLVLDLPAEVGLARAAARLSGAAPDRFERDDAAVHERRRQAFLDIARRDPRRCVVIDATADQDTVAEAIWQTVRARLLNRAA
jgi:dTMP kinase